MDTAKKIEPEHMGFARALTRKVWDSYPKKRKSKTREVKQAYKDYRKMLNEKTEHILGIFRSGRGINDEVFKKALNDFNDTIIAIERGFATANAWMELVEQEKK